MRSTVIVVEAGPAVVRGVQECELGREAIQFIDDELMLVDDRAVAVTDVWDDVLRTAVGDAAQPVVVVHPTGWSRRRVDVVRAAAGRVCPEAVTLSRADVLRATATTVVEIADDLVVIAADAVAAVPRRTDSVVERIVRQIDGGGPVAVDAPEGVTGARSLARAIVAALRDENVSASLVGAHRLREAVRARPPVDDSASTWRHNMFRPRHVAVLAGAALTAVTVGAAVAVRDLPPPAEPMAMLVEGHVGVVVPAGWTVRRITDGPGSHRLRAVAPGDDAVAVHVTQSALPQRQSLEQIATTLRTALAAQSDAAFTEFRPDDRRAGRPVASYRERRSSGEIAWFVTVDGFLRIAIGCQSPIGRTSLVDAACDAAVRSAHAVF